MERRIAVRAAGVGLGVAALAGGAAHPALATASAHVSYSTLGSSAVFAARPDRDVVLDVQERIAALSTWANALAAKVAAIPSTTVVAGRERLHLLGKLAMVKRAIAAIDVATSASSPLTGAQKAQLTSVAAALREVLAKLTTVLANAPAPATLKPRVLSFAAKAADPIRHHCDGDHDFSGTWTWWGWGDHHWGH